MSFFVILPEVDLVVALQGNLLFQPFGPFAEAAYAVAELFLAEGSTAQVPPSKAGPTAAESARGSRGEQEER